MDISNSKVIFDEKECSSSRAFIGMSDGILYDTENDEIFALYDNETKEIRRVKSGDSCKSGDSKGTGTAR